MHTTKRPNKAEQCTIWAKWARKRWGVPLDVITTSNSKEDTITKIKRTMINSNVRAYHKIGRRGKHAMWSRNGLNVRMY